MEKDLLYTTSYQVCDRKLMIRLEKEKKEINFSYYPAITASNKRATIFVILIIGFTAGPAVSL